MSFEVWAKDSLGQARGVPENSFSTLDFAMLEAKRLSKGTKMIQVWNQKSGDYDNVPVPLMFAVVDRNGKQSRVRGYGANGKWLDARDCKRCASSGIEKDTWQEPCRACFGSSYRPKV